MIALDGPAVLALVSETDADLVVMGVSARADGRRCAPGAHGSVLRYGSAVGALLRRGSVPVLVRCGKGSGGGPGEALRHSRQEQVPAPAA